MVGRSSAEAEAEVHAADCGGERRGERGGGEDEGQRPRCVRTRSKLQGTEGKTKDGVDRLIRVFSPSGPYRGQGLFGWTYDTAIITSDVPRDTTGTTHETRRKPHGILAPSSFGTSHVHKHQSRTPMIR